MKRFVWLGAAAGVCFCASGASAIARPAPSTTTVSTTAAATTGSSTRARRIDTFKGKKIATFQSSVAPLYKTISTFWSGVVPEYKTISTFWGDLNPFY